MTKSTLSDRIAAAIKAGRSKGIPELIQEAETAALATVEDHERARKRALDPLISDGEIAEARKAMEDAEFTRERMSRAADVLRDKLAEFQDAEDQADRQQTYDAAIALRDATAKLLRERYVPLANELGALMQAVLDAEREILDANRSAPRGCPEIRGVEMTARPGLAPGVSSGHRMLTQEVNLPALAAGRASAEPVYGSQRTADATGFVKAFRAETAPIESDGSGAPSGNAGGGGAALPLHPPSGNSSANSKEAA